MCSSPVVICSSYFCGPRFVMMYESPFITWWSHLRYLGLLCTGKACLMLAGVAMSGLFSLLPIHTVLAAVLAASSFPCMPLCPFTHARGAFHILVMFLPRPIIGLIMCIILQVYITPSLSLSSFPTDNHSTKGQNLTSRAAMDKRYSTLITYNTQTQHL